MTSVISLSLVKVYTTASINFSSKDALILKNSLEKSIVHKLSLTFKLITLVLTGIIGLKLLLLTFFLVILSI